MATKIWVNLPVKNLKKSISFFEKMGFSFNQQFTDDKAACLVIVEDNIYSMLITEEFFTTFTNKPISDAKKTTEVLMAIDVESREELENLVNTAVVAGGRIYKEPQDHGWMYQHGFEDLDGHQWELLYMDPSKMPQQ